MVASSHFLMDGSLMIKDNFSLLDTMMNDFDKQSEEYRPEDFWVSYGKINFMLLRYIGAQNFARTGISQGFGGRFTKKFIFSFFPRAYGLILRIGMFLVRVKVPFDISVFYTEDPDRIRSSYGSVLIRSLFTQPNGERLADIDDDLLGNPIELIEGNGKTYSLAFLDYFHRALMLEKYLKISDSTYFFEIGPGYGGLADVLLKLYPHLKVCLVDNPPQLYLTEQYLRAMYPDDVLGYEETKDAKFIDRSSFDKKRIIILAPWDVSKIKDGTFEVFTNQQSFQEMSPTTTKRYCEEVNRLVTKGVFLDQQSQGCGGVKDPAKARHYFEFLSNFERTETVDSGMPSREYYVFRRENDGNQ
jgi:putative sugar O-methyltransferase